MRRFKFFICLTVLFWTALIGYSQNFSRAQTTEKSSFPINFSFTALKSEYVVDAENGKAEKTINGRKESFRMPLDKGDSIEEIYFSEYADDLFLFYGVNNGGEAATQLLKLDAPSNKLRWKVWLPIFNITGILADNNGYFAGVGFIASVNLTTGKFIWKHENLYTEEYGKIQIFTVPKVEADKVIFKKDETDVWSRKSELVVDKDTGKNLSIK